MRKVFALFVCILLLTLPARAENANERLESCGVVTKEILDIPDNIPQDLLDKAECVIVIPNVVKVAIGFSGSWGKGAMSCRSGANYDGSFGAPAMVRLEGGGFGLQLGGQATDFVLLVMNERGISGILKSKVKLGADMAAAAGPKGRDLAAATDATMRAEILTYSRSRGLFAGISLEGSTLRTDDGANKEVYGRDINAKEIILKRTVKSPASAQNFVSQLSKHSPKHSKS
jgi:lipid-binding SYLF domain-containing protein